MEHVEYHGWKNCIRCENSAIEVISSTIFGPRIMRFAFVNGENVMGEAEDLYGKVGPADSWVNYGGHRLWHAPQTAPRTAQPDNIPIEEAILDGRSLILHQGIEPNTGIGKQMRVTLGKAGSPAAQVDHILANHNLWPVELAPWALSVVAPGGRVIFPQETFVDPVKSGNYGPARAVVLWPYAQMGDPRYTWGTSYIQVRSDATRLSPMKLGLYCSAGWGAFHSAAGDLFLTFMDMEDLQMDDFTDMGCNFETYTAGGFQELESLGPLELLEPGEMAEHTEHWVLLRKPDLPADDAGLAEAMPAIIEEALDIIADAFPG